MAHILLLEPDTILASIYTQYIEKQGYVVTHTKEASEAIRQLDAKHIDLVIIEIQIAAHNGIEFLYEMRSYTDWKDIPVIIQTMASELTVLGSGLFKNHLNISEILYKPKTSLHILSRSVNRIIKNPTVI